MPSDTDPDTDDEQTTGGKETGPPKESSEKDNEKQSPDRAETPASEAEQADAEASSGETEPLAEALPDDVDADAAREETTEFIDEQTTGEQFAVPESSEPASLLSAPSKWLAGRIARLVREQPSVARGVRNVVEVADIDRPADLFLADIIIRALAVGAFVFGTVVLGGSGFVLTEPTAGPGLLVSVLLLAMSAGGVIGLITLAATVVYLQYVVSERRREIDVLLPDAISYMYTQSVGGMPHIDIFRSLAKAEDTYGEIASEFSAIVREAEYFGIDYQAAIAEQADTTPSDEFSRFLTDMLTVIRSGGNLSEFLDSETEVALRTSQNERESTLDVLELLAQVYLVASLFPVVGITVLIILSALQPIGALPFVIIVYIAVPVLSGIFLVAVDGIRTDDLGSGLLSQAGRNRQTRNAYTHRPELTGNDQTVANQQQRTLSTGFGGSSAHNEETDTYAPRTSLHPATTGIFSHATIDEYDSELSLFEAIRSGETRYKLESIVTNPVGYFREQPTATLPVTLALIIAVLGAGLLAGVVPVPTPDTFVSSPLETTLWWLHFPVIGSTLPLVAFSELNRRTKQSVYYTLPETLRKVASANDTGMTLLESIQAAQSEAQSRVDEELQLIADKAAAGMPVSQALVEFNNAYRMPKLARITRLIIEAQQTSEHIAYVLQTAVRSAENTIQIEKKQASETQVQVVIILITALLVLGIMLMLDRVFVPILTTGGIQSIANPQAFSQAQSIETQSAGISPEVSSVLFLHAVSLHAIVSSVLAGYIKTGDILSGFKYAIPLLVIIATTWFVF